MRFGAGCLIIHDWHVLLGLRASGESEPLTWAPFGGGCKPGETAAACMIREVCEETGIRLDPRRCAYLGSQRRHVGFAYHTFAAFPAACPVPALNGESRDAGWFPLGDAPGNLWGRLPASLHPGMRDLCATPTIAAALLSLRLGGPRSSGHERAPDPVVPRI